MPIKATKLFLTLFIVLILSGCQAADKLRWLDNQAGKLFNSTSPKQIRQEISSSSKVLEWIKIKSSDLTKEQQVRIDKFLEDNSLNRYGDPVGTMYTGGTPLFNEITGERIDRFEYIINKYPELWQEIKK
ncbi:MAG: hypothetical protein NTW06_02955 [Candidatus Falkowbacteria bacterium]|nr:hypothetical protein [Candidatus Falkowbacteria bacterium]